MKDIAMTNGKQLKTEVSKAYWCMSEVGNPEFRPAIIGFGNDHPEEISWFDRLFKGGIFLPKGNKPITMLITGPPGSGKTSLSLEFCYRIAKAVEAMSSIYISTDSETDRLINNLMDFGWEKVDHYILKYKKFDENILDRDVVRVWGKENIESSKTLSEIVDSAVKTIGDLLHINANKFAERLSNSIKHAPLNNAAKSFHDVIVIDSLNIVEPERRSDFFDQFLKVTSSGTQIVIFILDSGSINESTHMYWEYACDIVLRLDYSHLNDYYIRTIEIIKARYQSHVWGKHQLKIYSKLDMPNSQSAEQSLRFHRAHPYRKEGGIFIFPAIHYYLSLYKKNSITVSPQFVDTFPKTLNSIVKLPEGRCTAFVGQRGTHKSHLGYLHLLHTLVNKSDEGCLVISLRDDEQMTKGTLLKIINQEFLIEDLSGYEKSNRLDILYYPPGYITPEEFFHRMFMSIHRLKKSNKKLTVLFNSLDQLSTRFPLCARQEIFIPGIIETLSGEGITSIFVSVNEPNQPLEQYGLLQMADLIVSFYRYNFQFMDYFNQLNETLKFSSQTNSIQNKVNLIKQEFQSADHETVVLQVERFGGGEKAGDKGILELINEKNLDNELYEKAGLHFTKLNPKYPQGSLASKK